MPASIPASASATAVALPMPESEPVTIAVFGVNAMPGSSTSPLGRLRENAPRQPSGAPRSASTRDDRRSLGWCAVPEPSRRALSDPSWWRDAVVYQVYPRSFGDGNADGVGDFAGLIPRIPYLERLGVDAIWLSPFYPSAL